MKIKNNKIWFLATVFGLLASVVSAIPGDFDSDGVVAIADLQIFAESWLTNAGGDLDSDADTDLADFAILASHWLEGCPDTAAVNASDTTTQVDLAGSITFTLPATSTVGMTYRVTSLPAYGTLYNGPSGAEITTVPFVLDSNSIHYHAHTSNAATVSFTWSAATAPNACGTAGSDTATATLTIYVPPTAPTNTPQSVGPVTHVWQTVTLAATDDGLPVPPGRLKYIITTLPTNAQLYDPKSGAGKITKVPYTLSSWGNVLALWTTATGADSFSFAANDGGAAPYGQGSAATVSINATANPKDCLSFDGRGLVTITDGTYLDAASGWAIDFWIKTRQPYSTLVKKRGMGAGYEIKLVGGVPRVEFYTAAGLVAASEIYVYGDYGLSTLRVDNGQWNEIGIVTATYGGGWMIKWWINQAEANTPIISGAFPALDNAEPVVLGVAYKNQFDKLRFFAGLTDPTAFTSWIQSNGRTESSGEFQLFLGATSSVLFMCDEATGTTITDMKTGKVGTFNSADHVSWLPYFDPFMDVSVQQNYRGTR